MRGPFGSTMSTKNKDLLYEKEIKIDFIRSEHLEFEI